MKTARDIGENRLIERLIRHLPGRPDVVTGAGDDCAVVRSRTDGRSDLLLTSDPVIEGVHFRPDTKPEFVGRKAVGRVLSDIAAMGGEPLWAVVNLVIPPRVSSAWVERVYRGAGQLARRWNMAIAGGDTSAGPVRELHVFAVGRVPRGTALLRSGAHPGDAIYVTGELGGSGAGHHLRFDPRIAEGAWLRSGKWATALMDLSDGLATDLPRMMRESGVGALLEEASIPVSAAARRMKGRRTPLEHALCDGEDFELLFTVREEKTAAFEKAWMRRFRLPCTRIGTVSKAQRVIELIMPDGRRTKMAGRGFEHFAASSVAAVL